MRNSQLITELGIAGAAQHIYEYCTGIEEVLRCYWAAECCHRHDPEERHHRGCITGIHMVLDAIIEAHGYGESRIGDQTAAKLGMELIKLSRPHNVPDSDFIVNA